MIEMKMDCREYLYSLATFLQVEYDDINDAYLEIMKIQPERWGGGTVEPAVAQMLYIIVKTKEFREILEVGTNQGYSTWFIAKALESLGITKLESEFLSIDIDEEVLKTAEEKCNGLPVYIECENSQNEFSPLTIGPEFVFLDASHEYEQTKNELKRIQSWSSETLVALHDVFSDGVSRALQEFPWSKQIIFPTQPNTGFGLVIP